MLIPKFYLTNSTNIECLLWVRHCLSSQGESIKKVDKKEEGERRRKKEQNPKLFILEFQTQILEAS